MTSFLNCVANSWFFRLIRSLVSILYLNFYFKVNGFCYFICFVVVLFCFFKWYQMKPIFFYFFWKSKHFYGYVAYVAFCLSYSKVYPISFLCFNLRFLCYFRYSVRLRVVAYQYFSKNFFHFSFHFLSHFFKFLCFFIPELQFFSNFQLLRCREFLLLCFFFVFLSLFFYLFCSLVFCHNKKNWVFFLSFMLVFIFH